MKASFGVWHGHWGRSGPGIRYKYYTFERFHTRLYKFLFFF